jgi:hypothetical protein
MKKLLVFAVVIMLSFLMISMVGRLLAQQETKEEMVEYAYGKVSSVSADKIIVTEFDIDASADVDVTYLVDPKVELSNVDKLEYIAAGDSVVVHYLVKDSEKVAKAIAVEKKAKPEEQAAAKVEEQTVATIPTEQQAPVEAVTTQAITQTTTEQVSSQPAEQVSATDVSTLPVSPDGKKVE